MGFDATVLAAVVQELDRRLRGGRIHKIYQPTPWELHLLVYAGREHLRLLLSCHPQGARLHLTQVVRPNPPHPPTFCMLLRKHLEGGRILAVRQVGRERIAHLEVGALDELGNPVTYTLVAEVMGKHSNLLLLAPGGRIIDAARRATEEQNRYREVLPGLPYVPPPPTGKLDPGAVTGADLGQWLARAGAEAMGRPAWQLVLDAVDGLGPLVAREIAHRAGVGGVAGDLGPAELDRLAQACRELYALVDSGSFAPTLLLDESGEPKDFAVVEPRHWAGATLPVESVSALLDRFYAAQEERQRTTALRAELRRVLAQELGRVRRKLQAQLEDLRRAEEAEPLRQKGELLMAYLWQVPRGADRVELPNFYDPEQRPVVIELDPALSPAENAQAYFRRYQKARSGLQAIREQVERSQAELRYLEQVEATLAAAASLPELEEIRAELAAEGYLDEGKGPAREKRGRAGGEPGAAGNRVGEGARGSGQPSRPLVVRSSDGLEIWVGRNNRQNETLTFKLAAPTDLWLHAKEIPGAHVILRLPPGVEPPEASLREAALLAAYFSKARLSANVPVDYTLRRHVRKPPGARPGMVIYDHHRTLHVTPDPEREPFLRQALAAAGVSGTAPPEG
ncbi:MAG: NFACT family protein [Firmicutes bacterium]|nr:NFACT family protein [Bacillota bacterium]